MLASSLAWRCRLLSSVIRRAIPAAHVYLGEIDLDRAVRPIPEALANLIADSAAAGHVSPDVRLYCAPGTAALLEGTGIDVVAVVTLDEAVEKTFKEMP
jgi:predicted ATP-dependent serine protease